MFVWVTKLQNDFFFIYIQILRMFAIHFTFYSLTLLSGPHSSVCEYHCSIFLLLLLLLLSLVLSDYNKFVMVTSRSPTDIWYQPNVDKWQQGLSFAVVVVAVVAAPHQQQQQLCRNRNWNAWRIWQIKVISFFFLQFENRSWLKLLRLRLPRRLVKFWRCLWRLLCVCVCVFGFEGATRLLSTCCQEAAVRRP